MTTPMEESEFINNTEAAKILGISLSAFGTLVKRGLFTSYTGTLAKAKHAFSREEVLVFKEIRTDSKFSNHQVTNLALRALVKATRAEKLLHQICEYMGFSFVQLKEDRESVLQFLLECTEYMNGKDTVEQDKDFTRRLLAISEGYLGLVKQYTGSEEPWTVFLALAKQIASRYPVALPAGVMMEHTIRNLRHCAFMLVCSTYGVKVARKAFREDTFTARMAQSLFAHH